MSTRDDSDHRYHRLGESIARLQSRFILGRTPEQTFDPLLGELLEFTASEYGFIAELHTDAADGHRFLRVIVLTDISWDDDSRAAVAQHRSGERLFEFHRLDTLFGAAVLTGRPVISNDPDHDPRRTTRRPRNHAPMRAFLGLPLFHGGVMVGMVGLANRPGGYDEALAEFLQPLTASVGAIIGAVRLDQARREAEQALRDSEARLRATFELAAVGIAHVAANGRLLRVNRKLCEIFGRDEATMRSLSYLDLALPQDRARDREVVSRLLAGERLGASSEKRYLHGDGRTIWCNLAVTLVRDRRGEPDYFIAVVEDITGRKTAEEALLAAQAAERANAAKSEFLSHMSHELRTPLNAVLGFAQLMPLDAQEPLGPAQRERVRRIESAGRHLLAMIDDMLDFARIEAGGLALAPQRVPLRSVGDDALAMVSGQAREAGVTLHGEGGDPFAAVVADPRRLTQVLVNLLSNAVKYNRQGGRVTLAWRPAVTPGWLELVVSDTGVGLSAEQIARLYEPFNRLGAERSLVQGTGIGLVITRRLVEMMGGHITVSSEPGRGSRFAVELPAHADRALPPSASALPQPAPSASSEAAPSRHRLLYAEDNELNALLVAEIVRLRPGWELLQAASGQQALRLAREARPDLLMLDMHLGDMTALQVRHALAGDAALAGARWLVLSADAEAATLKAAEAAGFDDYLSKPIEVQLLLRWLDRVAGAGK